MKRPEVDQKKLEALIKAQTLHQVVLVGVRGYREAKNLTGTYDDALFLRAPSGLRCYPANTDPSKDKPGEATLCPGLWSYKVGIHGLSKPPEKRYTALVQSMPVKVQRSGGKDETGYFGINIHRGGYSTTGSEGCQTIYPDYWSEFIGVAQEQLTLAQQSSIPYLLVENADGLL